MPPTTPTSCLRFLRRRRSSRRPTTRCAAAKSSGDLPLLSANGSVISPRAYELSLQLSVCVSLVWRGRRPADARVSNLDDRRLRAQRQRYVLDLDYSHARAAWGAPLFLQLHVRSHGYRTLGFPAADAATAYRRAAAHRSSSRPRRSLR